MNLKRLSVISFITIFAILTISRNSLWGDSLLLWLDVTKKSPFKIRPCINLGGVYIKLYDFRLAKDAFLRCAELINRKVIDEGVFYYIFAQVEVYLNLAAIYGSQGDLERAMEFLTKAYEVSPDSPKTNYSLAFAYMEKDDTIKAESYLKRAISIADDPKAYFLYGELKERDRDYDSAIKFYKKAVELEPENSLYRVRLGYIYRLMNMPELAEYEWNKAIRLNPMNVDAYVNLGSLYYERGFVKKAYSLYKKALDIKPDSIDALLGAGNAADEMGNHPLAIEYYKKALSIEPQNALIYENLSIALKRAGDTRGAQEAMEKAKILRKR